MTAALRSGVILTVLTIAFGLAIGPLQAADGIAVAQEAPTETPAPSETSPPDTSGEETAWWVLLIVLGGLFILIVALLAGRRRKPKSTAAVPAWRTHARTGYAEARWLADNMTEDLAIWHGDALYEERDDSAATDAANAKIWDQISTRKQRAADELYAFEAASGPGSQALKASQQTTTALNDTYTALTERSDARVAYRTVAESEDPAGDSLTPARDREVRASGKLSAAREQLATGLAALKPIA